MQASSMPTGSTLPVSACMRSLTKVSVSAMTRAIGPLSHIAVSMEWASRSPVTPGAGDVDVEPPEAGAALRHVGGDGPVLQVGGAVVEGRPMRPSSIELLGQRDRRHAAIVEPDHVRHARLLDRGDHLLALGRVHGQRLLAAGSSCRPAAAASAISLCMSFGTQMSTRSMSARAISFRQSVSIDS